MASDKKASGEGYTYTVTKIRRCPDGRLIGVSGKCSACSVLLDWLETGAHGDPPVKLDSDDWGDMIEVRPDGSVWLWGEYGRYRVHDNIAAIGSGMSYALGAMACGKTAEKAVAIAALFDPMTDARVDVLPLKATR